MASRIEHLLDSLIVRCAAYMPRSWFWQLRAKKIDQNWGTARGDYEVIANVIEKTGAKSILDIGCGTGRLFPLFLQKKIQRIVGQDVSRWALQQAEMRYPSPRISLTHQPLTLLRSEEPFDLIISNRVLSAVKPKELEPVLRRLSTITNYLYLNEYGPSDGGQPSSYWFMHDYHKILPRVCSYTLIEEGKILKQTYQLLGISHPLKK